ncbi:transcription termination factor 2 isoform X2 [Lingula anatina]|uniref:Transcription termination factor 2 n=1 Tax=Lingula anatina TaxID=7574 RepID=A0A1S3I3Z7_LINAN|nr:transcription termination factor 2 isoform X2 [Lingula anatina]|eukprot:XP_013392990.1 transcription termination factor 2 isoform X2 [Lingula anatina]
MDIVSKISEKPCFVKTGTKGGPNQGRSYFICSQANSQCGFVKDARLQPLHCFKHPEHVVELQAVMQSKSTSEKRHFFRCNIGRHAKKNWCGAKVIENQVCTRENQGAIVRPIKSGQQASSVVPLQDHNQPRSSHTLDKYHNQPATKEFKNPTSRPYKPLAVPQDDDDADDDDDDCVIVDVKPPDSKPFHAGASINAPLQSTLIDRKQTESTLTCFQRFQQPSATNVEKLTESLMQTSLKDRVQSRLTGSSGSESDNSADTYPSVARAQVKSSESGSDSSVDSSPSEHRTTEPESQQCVAVNPQGARPKDYKGATKAQLQSVVKLDVSQLNRDIALRNGLVKKLERQQEIFKKFESTLPDSGHKLKQQIGELERMIQAADLRIDNQKKQLPKEGSTDQPPPSQQLFTTIPAKNYSNKNPDGLRQTQILNHVVQLPQHAFQQLYAANPQAMTLYQGRMTASKMRQVGAVTAEAIETIHRQLETCPLDRAELADPNGLTVTLMPHQRQALAWLTWREKQHPPGGILADDMGLGKTLTMISLVLKQNQSRVTGTDEEKSEWLSKDKQKEKLSSSIIKSHATLIVCPASLVHQWHREIENRCRPGLLNVILYHGPNREASVIRLAKADIVLTTYSIVSREVGIPEDMKNDKAAQESAVVDDKIEDPTKQSNLLRIGWERLILDEGHNIKNHKSLTAMSVCRLRAGSRWALTGTPIQNDLLDMYSLIRFLRCSPFDELKVWKRQVADNKTAHGTKRLNTLVKSLLLRRTKGQTGKEGKPLVSLPDKMSFTHELNLSKEERTVYDKVFAESRATLIKYLQRQEEKESIWGGEQRMSNTGHAVVGSKSSPGGGGTVDSKPPGAGQMLLLLLRLRQCCSHLSLLKNVVDQEDAASEGIELTLEQQMQAMALVDEKTKEPDVSKSSDVFETSSLSTKIAAVMERLREIRKYSEGTPMKSVIVSQWTKVLEIVAYHLKQAGYKYHTIQGNITPKLRADAVDDFNTNPEGPEVMLVSLKAGGVGLNLVGGNHLFLLDIHWNPALELQACDRVYRVGQTKNVHIHRETNICTGCSRPCEVHWLRPEMLNCTPVTLHIAGLSVSFNCLASFMKNKENE